MRVSDLEVGETVLFYEQFGSGPDIVWVPGGDQTGSEWQHFQVPHFEDRYRNTTYDPRGVGQTTTPLKDEYSVGEHAIDLAGLIRAACDPPVIVIGLSMGSLITQEMALSYPSSCGAPSPWGQVAWGGPVTAVSGWRRKWRSGEEAGRSRKTSQSRTTGRTCTRRRR